MLPNHDISTVAARLQATSTRSFAQSHITRPRILVLYGSLRASAYSRRLANEVVSILTQFGAEVRLFDPQGLPVFDGASIDDSKVIELREASQWSEGQVWISPEIHGTVSGVFKNQIDWLPLDQSAMRATQGKTLAVMQISGGSQSFNTVNTLRILGRWMRMFTIPNQSSIPKAWMEFDSDGALKDSAFKDRVVDVMEELFKTTLLMRGQSEFLTERFSENKSHYQNSQTEALVGQALR